MVEHTTYGFVGAGAIGQALGGALQRAQQSVKYWDQSDELCTVSSLSELISKSSVIILAIPSNGVREVLRHIKHELKPEQTILTVAKGVESGFITMYEVLKTEIETKANYGLLYGPMLADEIIAGQRAYGVLALSHAEPTNDIIAHFASGNIFLTYSSQIADVAMCGVLKNIYALGLGVADGLNVGINTKATLTVAMLAEMQNLLHHFQLSNQVVLQDCGLGDLLATGWSKSSHNHQHGEEIGQGDLSHLGGEGLNSLTEIIKVVEPTNYPILNCIHHIIVSKAPAEQLYDFIR